MWLREYDDGQHHLSTSTSVTRACRLTLGCMNASLGQGEQTVFSCLSKEHGGIELGISPEGGATVRVCTRANRADGSGVSHFSTECCAVGTPLWERTWYTVWATYNPEFHELQVGQFRVENGISDDCSDVGVNSLKLNHFEKVCL